MRIRKLHALPKDQQKFELRDLTLGGIGLTPVLRTANEKIADKLAPFGLSFPLRNEAMEIFASEDGSHAILAKIAVNILDLVIFARSDDELSALVGKVKSSISVDLADGSTEELALVNQLHLRNLAPSPHGKMLDDASIQEASRALRNDNLRQGLKAILQTFGDNFVPKPQLQQVEVFASTGGSVEALAEMGVLAKQFQVFCNACQTPHLIFPQSNLAEDFLKSAKCVCGRGQLQMVDVYRTAGSYLKSLQQGVWLEQLARDVLAATSQAIWAGQMVGPHEIDVLVVLSGEVVLVECKDTRLGLSDLYSVAVKAQDLEASTVILLSTQELPANSSEMVSSWNRQGSGVARNFEVVCETAGDEIDRELKRIVERLQEKEIGGLTLSNLGSWSGSLSVPSILSRWATEWR